MKDKLTVDEINIKLQEAVARDVEDREAVLKPVLAKPTELEPDVEGWDEYVERVLKEDPPEEVDEEVI